MQGAVAVASQLETWLEHLPGRLNGAIARVEGIDPADLEAVSRIGEHAILFPDFLSALQEACNEMRATTEALVEANSAASRLESVDAQHASERQEFDDSAALATEMTNLSFGHALRLEDVIGQLMRAAEGLPDLGKNVGGGRGTSAAADRAPCGVGTGCRGRQRARRCGFGKTQPVRRDYAPGNTRRHGRRGDPQRHRGPQHSLRALRKCCENGSRCAGNVAVHDIGFFGDAICPAIEPGGRYPAALPSRGCFCPKPGRA